MRRLVRLLSLPVVCSALPLQAQAPVITGFHPDNLIVHPERVFVYTHLTGNNFWVSGPNDASRRHLYVRQAGGAWTDTDIRIDSITPNDLGIHLLSQPYLAAPGLLEFKVTVDGVDSNIFPVQVRKLAPQLDLVSPEQVLMKDPGDTSSFSLFLRLHHWVDPLELVINGRGYGTLFQATAEEETKTPWPRDLWKPGVYTVQLRNALGTSGPKIVEIVGLPLLTGAAPAVIHPSDWSPKGASATTPAAGPQPAGTTRAGTAARLQATPSGLATAAHATLPMFELKAAFQGSTPTSLSWQTDRSSWQDLPVRGAIKGFEARVPLPVAALAEAAWVELRMGNKAGESRLRIPILPDPIQIHRDPLKGEVTTAVQPPPPAARSTPAELPPLPPPVVQRAAALWARLQPSARAWVEEQVSRQRGLPAPDLDAVRSGARVRFARPAAPAATPFPASRPAAGKALTPAPSIPMNPVVAGNLGSADIEALAFLVLAQASKGAQDDLKTIMDGVKKTQQQKARLREMLNQIARERPGTQRTDAPCSSPLCGTIAGQAKDLAAQLPAKARPTVPPLATYGDLARLEANLKNSLVSMSELGETESLRLQMAMDRLSKFMAVLSNLEKKVDDSSQAILGNLK